ncbi:hypothetical protein [Uliginosibacterium gangwonense]|uniref:hypothetical protein n=1 Tax=Uliginosibacterium gangwonense TaxID=392736 RepID=UPI00035D80AC|nr:hypothetical protein [Uliginosibacterium gangwonense]
MKPNDLKLNVLSAALSASNDTYPKYKDAILKIMTYSAQVKGYVLPGLSHAENWPGGKDVYAKTQEDWAKTTGSLRAWAVNVLEDLTFMPEYLLRGSVLIIIPTLDVCISDVDRLIKNPKDQRFKQDLLDNLNILDEKFKGYNGRIDTLIKTLEDQRNVFDTQAAQMRTIADNAMKTKGVDQNKIKKLNQEIDQLQADITARAIAIAGGSVAAILGIAIGVVGIGLAVATGGVSLFLLIPALLITAGGAYIIATNAIQIEEDKAKIAIDSAHITELEADVVLLQKMSETLSGFANQVAEMKTALSTIIQPWSETSKYLQASIATIKGMEESTSDDWVAVKGQLELIRTGWDVVTATMKEITIDGKMYPNAKLEIGMNDTQVKQALDASKSVNIVQYLAA